MPKGYFCKINISYPTTGASKMLEIEDFRKVQTLHGLRMASEFDGAVLGEQYAGCTFRITGGNDAQGFAMYQGVLKSQRVRLLLKGSKWTKCYNAKRSGERRRRSVRGCIVGPDLHALSVVLVEPNGKELEGLTDTVIPKRLNPKRASRIRRLFGLPHKKVDPKDQLVVKDLVKELGRTVTLKDGTTRLKFPKIQRLVTDAKYQGKQKMLKQQKEMAMKSWQQAKEYRDLLTKCNKKPTALTKMKPMPKQ